MGAGLGSRSQSPAGSEQIVVSRHARPPPPPQLSPASTPEEWGSEPRKHGAEHRLKSVEWSALPLVGTSSSGGSISESSSSQHHLKAKHHLKQKVTRPLPQALGHASEQPVAQVRSCSRDYQAEPEGGGVSLPWLLPFPAPAGL